MGLTVDELQEEVSVATSAVTGTLLSVVGYTGFSDDETLQDGHYLALHLDASVADATFNVVSDQAVKYLEDGDIVVRVTDEDTVLTISASKSGYQTVMKEFTLLLTLEK